MIVRLTEPQIARSERSANGEEPSSKPECSVCRVRSAYTTAGSTKRPARLGVSQSPVCHILRDEDSS